MAASSKKTTPREPATPALEELWICPPLAFARFGRSQTPLENFHWADNDYAPRGTAETVIVPDWTLVVCEDGSLSAKAPSEEIVFKDKGDWRPLCPFFEVHGRWSDGREGPVSEADLAKIGLSLSDVSWSVKAGNRKAYHYTLSEGDLVEAAVTLAGNQHERTELRGVSTGSRPLVPSGAHIHLGDVQVIRPSAGFPELRLRITPPGGHIYAPSNTRDRDLSALLPANVPPAVFLAQIRTTLSPSSPWTSWQPVDDDYRTNPGGLYAQEPSGQSLGFMDDSNDGLIQVTLTGEALPGGSLTAYARYTCCPPDFQPDRRPFVSVADGLADALLREEVLEPDFISGESWPETELEIADLMQRVRETMEASNLDHQNLRSKLGNDGISGPDLGEYPFTPVPPRPGHPLPLLDLGRANHARFLAYDVFKQRLGQRPEIFTDKIRDPVAERDVYDTRMPALMRGSDSYPMTITQRQYDLMKAWLAKISAESKGGEGA